MWGGLLASCRHGGWLGLGSLPSPFAFFLSLSFSCVRFLALFHFVSFFLSMLCDCLNPLSMHFQLSFYDPFTPMYRCCIPLYSVCQWVLFLPLAVCVLPSTRLGIQSMCLFRFTLSVPSSASRCPWVACGLSPRENKLCWTQLPEHQRMNANGNGYQMIYFPETIIQ